MTRHTVVCLKVAGTETFAVVDQTSGEDGVQWSERAGLTSQFEALLQRVLKEIGQADGAEMPNLTLTTRTLYDVICNPPLVNWDRILVDQPGVSLNILAPIRIEATRDRYERWASLSRLGNGMLSAINDHARTAIQREWCDLLLRLFNAGETREGHSEPTFRAFARQPAHQRREVWVRPDWPAAMMVPEAFPLPKPFPVFDKYAGFKPHQMADVERKERVQALQALKVRRAKTKAAAGR